MITTANRLLTSNLQNEVLLIEKINKALPWWKDYNYTLEIITEYRRFMQLVANNNFRMVPSKYVDLAWHEHITFTKDYAVYCKETLQRDDIVHHMPSETSDSTAYAQTLDAYVKMFGTKPPGNIWLYSNVIEHIKYMANLLTVKKKKKKTPGGSCSSCSSCSSCGSD